MTTEKFRNIIFLTDIGSKTIQEANLLLFEDQSLLVNYITPFKNQEVVLRYINCHWVGK